MSSSLSSFAAIEVHGGVPSIRGPMVAARGSSPDDDTLAGVYRYEVIEASRPELGAKGG